MNRTLKSCSLLLVLICAEAFTVLGTTGSGALALQGLQAETPTMDRIQTPPPQYQQQQQQPEYQQQVNYQQPQYQRPEVYSSTPYSVPPESFYGRPYGQQQPGQYRPGGAVYAPQGLMLPVSLRTAISTQVAKPGDFIEGEVSQNISLGGRGYIPAGTVVQGDVAESTAGRRLSRSGELSIEFKSLQFAGGQTIPISAHLVGSIGKYKNKGVGNQDVFRGEGWGTKIGQFLLRGGLGAGLGAGLGTGIGAIAGGGGGAGRGAWSGAAIGGGIGAADMLLRKGKDVIIPTGTTVQVQLDEPVALPGLMPGSGSMPGSGTSYM
ncbi:MAG: hypothetical protein IPM23_11865 [Candidatus Melainabacteria bacterium]|nr:hypothetical protein [Candidatus Melainabacteria bacterium]